MENTPTPSDAERPSFTPPSVPSHDPQGTSPNLLAEFERAKRLMSLFTKAPDYTDKQIFEYALDIAVELTDSKIGFFHRVSKDQKDFILTTWNKEALRGCTASSAVHYPIESAGNWADCVRGGKPVIYNDFANSPNQKGLPKGHFPVTRFASVPVFDGDKVACVFGVGNKTGPYEEKDVMNLQLVANIMQEIIGQREAKIAAEENEARFQRLYSAMSDLVVLHEMVYGADQKAMDYRILDCNPAFTASTGIPREKAVGSLASEVYGVTPPPYLDHYAQAVATGKEEHFEVFFEPINKRFSITVLPTGPHRFATISIDITEKSRFEEELRKSEERHRSVVENALEAILVIQDGYVRYINEAGKGLLECDGSHIEEKPFIECVHSLDQAMVVERHRRLLAGRDPGKSFSYRVLSCKGKMRWVETNAVLIPWEGKPAVLKFMSDVTERIETLEKMVRSEEKFSKAFKVSSVGLLLTRWSDGKLLECNDSYLRMSGTPREEILGRSTLELGLWQGITERQEVMERLLVEGHIADYNLRPRLKNGEERVWRYSAELLEVEGERCVLSSFVDVTQQMRDEKTIQNLLERVKNDNEELRRLDNLKNEFISIVAHDLRTPLTSINGYLRFLGDPRMGKLDPQQQEFVDLAYKNSRRLVNLVANFLDLSVMESGELKIKPRYMRLNETVVDAIKALENLAVSKSIQVVANLPEVGIPLEADPDKMEQVYINLLGNAIKFTPPNGLITVGARLETRDGLAGVLGWVKDTGPGIPPAEAEKVFEKFYQIDNAETKMVLGTGLGLTICRRIVEAHGGRIWVESAEGKGAHFLFFLPTRV